MFNSFVSYPCVFYCNAEFMELMEFRFHEKAKRNGCFIVSAAGFDSVPADLGVLYTMHQFQAPAIPSSVTSFLSFQIGQAGIVGKSAFKRSSLDSPFSWLDSNSGYRAVVRWKPCHTTQYFCVTTLSDHVYLLYTRACQLGQQPRPTTHLQERVHAAGQTLGS